MCYKRLQNYKGAFLDRVPGDLMQKSCFILAIINAITNAVLFISCVYVEYRALTYEPPPSNGFLLGGIRWGARNKRDVIDDHLRHEGWFPTLWLIMIVTALFSIATIIFSVLLCYGIRKRRPRYVQSYFVYGVIITLMIIAVSVMHMCIVRVDKQPGLGISGLCGCALHSLYLVLVYKTFKKLQKESRYTQPILLQEVETRYTQPILLQEVDLKPSAPPLSFINDDETGFPVCA